MGKMNTSPINKEPIAIIGLGYVGLPLAVEFGKKRRVIGFDTNKKRILELSSGIDRTRECDKNSLIRAKNLEFTSDENKLNQCSIYIVTVPTPVDNANKPDLGALTKASEMIARHLKPNDVVVYESTVYPGTTEEVCVPILESTSGLKFNSDFFCGYSPERINPGDKVNTLTKIQKIVSGSSEATTARINNLYSDIIEAGTWVAPSIIVAEAAKVIENTQRDINIAFVNELSVIFNRLNIDTLDVLKAAGTKWNFLPFRPGMVGGHCIGVDPYYLTYKAEKIGYHPQIILAGRRMNDNMARYAARSILKKMSNHGMDSSNATVGLLGVTFKDNCPDIRNSKVFDLVKEFQEWGVHVVASDNWANSQEVRETYGIKLVKEIPKSSCDALIVAVAHSEYEKLSPDDLKELCKVGKTPILGDLKSIYDRQACINSGFEVFRL